ncbi:hypothetical protein Gogos_019875 [Gossypium gossypioides]|uniref:Uncharacterized protein n=1 Tax=Gossypium gossypioides TaxID=34282 RepID=A0A7J9D5T1_GOSGO|nr:hypothetical protein [Gossypium gossypioides]
MLYERLAVIDICHCSRLPYTGDCVPKSSWICECGAS